MKMKNFIVFFYVMLIISCYKNIGILFDVSGSMEDEFKSFNKINSINNKKSNELTKILKNFSQNFEINIFAILFGLSNSPYIIDFIKILKISNNNIKTLSKNPSKSYRDKLIYLLSNGYRRYCNIREYIFSNEGPNELLSEFFYNLIKDDQNLIDEIYFSLPKKVIDETYDKTTHYGNYALNGGLIVAGIALGPLSWLGAGLIGSSY